MSKFSTASKAKTPVSTRGTIKKPIISSRKSEYSEYYKWLEKLKVGVREGILKYVETNEDRLNTLLDDESMKIWASAFSDPSMTFVSYETLETLGDSVINPLVVNLALEQYPYSTSDQLSNFKTYYVKNAYQGRIMRDYTLNGEPFIKTYMLNSGNLMSTVEGYRLTVYIYSDFYEAIYGALLQAGRRVRLTTSDGVEVKGGMGYEYCERWFNHIFVGSLDGGRLDFKHSKKQADSILGSLFGKFEYYTNSRVSGFKVVSETVRRTPNDKTDTRTVVVTKILWTHGVITFLRDKDISGLDEKQIEKIPRTVDQPLIEPVREETKEESVIAACEKALQKLASEYGITEEWAEKNKKRLDDKAFSEDPDVRVAYRKLKRYCEDNGYTDIRFNNLQKHASKEGNIVALQLVVSKKNETIALRSKIFDQGDVHLCKRLLINEFVESKGL